MLQSVKNKTEQGILEGPSEGTSQGHHHQSLVLQQELELELEQEKILSSLKEQQEKQVEEKQEEQEEEKLEYEKKQQQEEDLIQMGRRAQQNTFDTNPPIIYPQIQTQTQAQVLQNLTSGNQGNQGNQDKDNDDDSIEPIDLESSKKNQNKSTKRKRGTVSQKCRECKNNVRHYFVKGSIARLCDECHRKQKYRKSKESDEPKKIPTYLQTSQEIQSQTQDKNSDQPSNLEGVTLKQKTLEEKEQEQEQEEEDEDEDEETLNKGKLNFLLN